VNPTAVNDTIVQEITIKAPAERIFEALTNPDERLKWWWGAKGIFEITHVESDLRPGATYRGWPQVLGGLQAYIARQV